MRAFCLLVACVAFCASAAAEFHLTEGTNISIDVAHDGRAVVDLLGDLWILPENGGVLQPLEQDQRPALRPRWSPGGDTLVYQSGAGAHDELWLHQLDTGKNERLDNGLHFNQHPSWHPQGERIVFSSDRHDSGFDLWEIDLATRLAWRLSSLPGQESEPTWSADGRNLAYVHEHEQRWSLMLRRQGQPDREIVGSQQRIAAPSWRPDGSLITYMQDTDDGWTIRMAILSTPILDREIAAGEDFFLSPVAWPNRQMMLFTANGHIRRRPFNSRIAVDVPFRAVVGSTNGATYTAPPPLDLPAIDTAQGTIIIRAARFYDGLSDAYQPAADIVIEQGRIAAIDEPQQARGSNIVIDLGDVTVLPGFVDAYASLPTPVDPALGPLLLGLGVGTLVADHPDAEDLNTLWSGKTLPGPRVIEAAEIYGARDAASWPRAYGGGPGARPASPAGRSYQDVQLAMGAATGANFVSGLADINTPNLRSIMSSRVAGLLSPSLSVGRRFASSPDLSSSASNVVLGSAPNGLPPGIALQAELRGLVAAGLSSEQAMKAGGVNAASLIGAGLKIGRIAPGASADLLLVDGDPLGDINDALRIVAVVRNGRFFSVSGLIDRAEQAQTSADVE